MDATEGETVVINKNENIKSIFTRLTEGEGINNLPQMMGDEF